MHIRLYLNYELLDLAFNSTVSLKCDGGGVLSCLLVLKGLFTDFTWGGGSRNTIYFKLLKVLSIHIAATVDLKVLQIGPKWYSRNSDG